MNIINLISSVLVALSIIWCSEQIIEFTGENLNITIYNQEMAFIEESRSASFSAIGEQKFRFIGLPEQLNHSSLQIVGNNCFINQINIFNHGITNQALLNSFVGKNVSLVQYDKNGGEKRYSATLLSNNNDPVFMVNDEIWVNPGFDVIYPYLPDNLAYNNSILCAAEVVNTENDFSLHYLTGGFSWDVDYFIYINNENTATVSAWHSIKNESLINYNNVNLSLVSGDVSFINSTQFNENKRGMMSVAKQSSTPNTSFTNDYAIFHVPGNLSLPQKSLSKYKFISEKKVKVNRSYHIEHTYRKYIKNNSIPVPVTSNLTINSNEIVDFNLPSGTFHVYEHLNNQNIFVGENIVPLTQLGDEVVLALGRTADITARFTYLSVKSERRVTTYKLRVLLKNIRNSATSVIWNEKISGDWKIIDSTDKYQKIDSQTAQFIVDIPSKNEKEIVFTVIINKN